MTNVIRKVLVVDSDSETARHTESLLTFLECEPRVAADYSTLVSELGRDEPLAAVLVSSDDSKLLECALSLLDTSEQLCGCYVLQGPDAETLPIELESQTQGSLLAPLTYRSVMDWLHRVSLYSNARKQDRMGRPGNFCPKLVGNSRSLHQMRTLIKQVAGTDASVLILGESGTGKEVIARGIHRESGRSAAPFVPVNCGAIPAELLESELFGHEKGAFTGAISSRQGRFEMADGGTLFLDEIGDMPLEMQVKLLRVLQERTFERVGSNKTMTANVRIVAATHQDLEEHVAQGKFRMDLFYRLNVFPIDVPPLRERVDDIPQLTRNFIQQMEIEQRGSLTLDQSAMAVLMAYPWPGNVRELSNLVERLAILYRGETVSATELPDKFHAGGCPPEVAAIAALDSAATEPATAGQTAAGASTFAQMLLPKEGINLKLHLTDIERTLMAQALEQSEWVVARAAKLLNLQRTTLVEKMRKFEIARPEETPEN